MNKKFILSMIIITSVIVITFIFSNNKDGLDSGENPVQSSSMVDKEQKSLSEEKIEISEQVKPKDSRQKAQQKDADNLALKYKNSEVLESSCNDVKRVDKGEVSTNCIHLVDVIYHENGDIYYKVFRSDNGFISKRIINYIDGYENGFNLNFLEHSYASYELEQLIELADQGDKVAQYAVVKKLWYVGLANNYKNKEIEIAKKYAYLAAKQGFTKAIDEFAGFYRQQKDSITAAAYTLAVVESYPKTLQNSYSRVSHYTIEEQEKIFELAEQFKQEIYGL